MAPLIDTERQQPPKYGPWVLQGLILALFCALGLRLWYLQIHRGAEFLAKAQDNRQRNESIVAPRGLIFDRDHHVLAINEPAYALGVIREDVADPEATLTQVAAWTDRPLEDLKALYQQARVRVKPFERFILVQHLTFEQVARIEADEWRWPGLEVVVRARRYYPQGQAVAHMLGYVGEANDDELAKNPSLDMGDIVGKQGLEYRFEDLLRGHKGRTVLEVDALGRRLSSRVAAWPQAGEDVNLSIDLDLQRLALKALQDNDFAGAVVVMEPFTGEVLALASNPAYDNNAFAAGLSNEAWKALRDDERHPLQYKATQGLYPPGSTFKLLVALAGLSDGVIDPTERIFCPGSIEFGGRVYRDWKKDGHGWVDLRKALVESCDVYFYEMGNRLGVDNIEAYARSAGFGQPTGIDLPHEKGGLIPSRAWKLRRFRERWQLGENLNLAIGQGYTLVSPLQVARFISAIVNGGYVLKPSILTGQPPSIQGRLDASPKQLEFVRQSMVDTVRGGTAKRLQRVDALMGGKTGTAQVTHLRDEDRGRKTSAIAYKYRDHSWIASFGIKDGRAVVVVALVEHGGHAGESAIPMAQSMYDHIFNAEEQGGLARLYTAWPYVAGKGPNPIDLGVRMEEALQKASDRHAPSRPPF